MKFEEHERVVLLEDLPSEGLQAGDVGTIIHLHENGPAYIVEFMTFDGGTIAIPTISESKLRAVGEADIMHVRTVAAPRA